MMKILNSGPRLSRYGVQVQLIETREKRLLISSYEITLTTISHSSISIMPCSAKHSTSEWLLCARQEPKANWRALRVVTNRLVVRCATPVSPLLVETVFAASALECECHQKDLHQDVANKCTLDIPN